MLEALIREQAASRPTRRWWDAMRDDDGDSGATGVGP
jgi:hypothetical protein